MRALSALALLAIAGLAGGPAPAADVDRGVIRLEAASSDRAAEGGSALGDAPRAFDFDSFQARLEGLWFERKALLAEGREADAARQADLMRAFCAEEGVQRVQTFASALIAEARRDLEEGSYEKALRSLDLAEAFDPGRAQTRMARAAAYWRSGGGVVSAIVEWARAIRAQFAASWRDLSLVNEIAFLVLAALLGCAVIFAALCVARHQVSIRHEISEALGARGLERWSPPLEWAALLAPLLTWAAAGWTALYWIPLAFRPMRRAERAVGIAFLLATATAVPAYRLAVALYGVSVDPLVRTMVAAASGVYEPERVVEMERLVEDHPDEAIYRFLLAGLHKNGRFFEAAHEQYKRVLDLEPASFPANVNLGNLFFQTGQYAEASSYYRKALEAQPGSVLVLYNLHLSQSEAFDFRGAEASLNRAREIDAGEIAALLSRKGAGERPGVVDARIGTATILKATLQGSRLGGWLKSGRASSWWRDAARELVNPVTFAAALALVACGIALASTRVSRPASRCPRCGRPLCPRCKSGRESHAYCSQCLHLFVLGDGLAPETKTRKLYEIERHERMGRLGRRLCAAVLPGAGHVLRGRPWAGCTLLFLWLLGWIAWAPALLVLAERAIGAAVRLDLLRLGEVPAAFAPAPLGVLAAPLLVAAWLAGNVRQGRRGEA